MKQSTLRSPLVFGSVLLVLAMALLSGCATGESAFKAGDFAQAARLSADRLARQPKHEKARMVFLNAYPQARAHWLNKAEMAEGDLADPFRWERAHAAYGVLRDLAARAALTPFAGSRGIVVDYQEDELEAARLESVAAREAVGIRLLGTGNLYDAREAYAHFEVALRYAGGREDLRARLAEARQAGTLVVGIDPVRANGHGVNPERVEAALIAELEAHPVHAFVVFVPATELGELGAMRFVDVSLGELSLDRREAEVGQRAFARVLPAVYDETGVMLKDEREVRGTVLVREKKVVARSLARIRVYDTVGENPVFDRAVESRSDWVATWDLVSGDRRAIRGEELRLTEPPDPEFADLSERLAHEIALETRSTLASYFRNG